MKILIIDNASANSVGDSIKIYKNTGQFGHELKLAGNNVTFTQFVNSSDNTISDFDLKEHGINFKRLSTNKNKLIRYVFSYISLIKLILKNDFIYVYYPNSLSLIIYLCIVLKRDYGLYVRGQNGIFNKKSQLFYKYAKVIFTVSDGFTEKIKPLMKNGKIYTVKPMISFSETDIVNQRELNIKDKLNILFLGRLDKDKGIYELIEAMSKLNKDKFSLEIVGDGIEKNNIAQEIIKLNLENNIFLKGSITNKDKIKEAYLKADLYVLPTYHEGFPRTLYEAMIFGVPILTTFVGGIPGLMKDGYNCLKINVKSSDDIVDKINFILNNKMILSDLSVNGLQTISNVLSTRKNSHAYLLNQILKDE